MGAKLNKPGKIKLTYKLDKNFFKENQNIQLFGKCFDLLKLNKNQKKWKIVIAGKEHKFRRSISAKELEKYGININDETLELILKAAKIYDMSHMFGS